MVISSRFLPVVAVILSALAAQEPAAGPASEAERNRSLKDAFAAGIQAENAKDWQAALTAFRQATALDPKQFAVWFHLADVAGKLARQSTGAAQRDQLRDESVAAFEKAVALKPGDAAVHNNYALALATAGNYAAARQQLDTAVRLDPSKAAQYYYNLGAVAVNDGRNQEGCDAFGAGLKADPNYAENHYQGGLCYFARATIREDGTTDMPPGARQGFSEYLRLSPAGRFADTARELAASLDTPVETNYVRPGYQPPAHELRHFPAVQVRHSPQPVYPPLARRARVQGAVRMDAVIDRAGDIAALRVVSGHPLFVPAALEAVKQWHYTPPMLDGKPIDGAVQITVNFRVSP